MANRTDADDEREVASPAARAAAPPTASPISQGAATAPGPQAYVETVQHITALNMPAPSRWTAWQWGLANLLLFLWAGALFLPGIRWGLPNRGDDQFLFPRGGAWDGATIQRLAGSWDDDAARGADTASAVSASRGAHATHSADAPRGADVASGPAAAPDSILNATPQQEARILRRYRLFSYQPDEWITFRALSSMHPSAGNFDPHLYQYGGFWIYPVGIALKIGSMLHLITLRSDLTFYLDHPEAFGRFYIVARLYCVLWGIVGVLTLAALARRIGGDDLAAIIAAAAFAALPLIVNMAHEAKPHLAGLSLLLLAVLCGARFVDKKRSRDALLAAVAAGAAGGMALSGALALSILPLMVWRAELPRRRAIAWLCISCGVGLGVIALGNPYLTAHLLFNRAALASNLGNSSAMYAMQRVDRGFDRCIALLGEGAGDAIATVGGLFLSLLVTTLIAKPAVRRNISSAILLLAIPAAINFCICVLIASGKPGEFARFLALPITLLEIACFAGVSRVLRPPVRLAALAVLLLAALWGGGCYWMGFVADASNDSTRHAAAELLAERQAAGMTLLGVAAEPAPYCMPPFDLQQLKLQYIKQTPRRFVLSPATSSAIWPMEWTMPIPPECTGQLILGPTGELMTPISWASKPFLFLSIDGRQ